jgi:adenosine deaminase
MDGFLYWHSLCAQVLQEASNDAFTARYILSFPRDAPLEAYALTKTLLDAHPELISTIVGIDFASIEEGFPPKLMKPFFAEVAKDNQEHPERALDIVYHVGESYFDKSLESAVRWCHEIAEMGAKRIGHAIALGLDPAIAVSRRQKAHEYELVSERLDQIAYDMHCKEALAACGVDVNEKALADERTVLLTMNLDEQIERPYDEKRLDEVRRRQKFVLDRLIELGTVIECCPTSNLRIGGVPDPTNHPLHKFLETGVNFVICSDDPGSFDITLNSEIDWVLVNTGMTEETLQRRLGNPRRFQLGQQRVKI